MTTGSYVADFEQAVRWLEEAWEKSSADWDDRVRDDLEADYWAPMTRAAAVFANELAELSTALEQARSEIP